MGVDIFLGEPPANIKQWIIDHSTPPGPAEHPETIFTLEGGTTESKNITGDLDQEWMIDNGYYDDSEGVWLKTITQVDIGNTVTDIGSYVFSECRTLTSVTIPDSVTSIWASAFLDCYSLETITVMGKTTAQAQSLLANASVPEGCTIVGELG